MPETEEDHAMQRLELMAHEVLLQHLKHARSGLDHGYLDQVMEEAKYWEDKAGNVKDMREVLKGLKDYDRILKLTSNFDKCTAVEAAKKDFNIAIDAALQEGIISKETKRLEAVEAEKGWGRK